jgi:hypothetical protein
MERKSAGGDPQEITVHVTRHREGTRYQVWLGLQRIGGTDSLTAARRRAARTKALELTECWETGKAYEKTPRGGWKAV